MSKLIVVNRMPERTVMTFSPGAHAPLASTGVVDYPDNTTLVFEPGAHEFATTAKQRVMRLGDNVRLVGKPGAVIRLFGDGLFSLGVSAKNIIVEGLTIERPTFSGASNYATALAFRGCQRVEVSECVFKNHGGMGIQICRDCGYGDGNRPFDALGASLVNTQHVLIRDCTFSTIAGAAIGCKPGGAEHVDILRCKINGFGSYGICVEGDAGGGRRGRVAHVTVSDCEITDGSPTKYHGANNSIYGIYVGEDANDIVLRNNTISDLRAVAGFRECGVAVCTSPSQGDRPVSGVRIIGNNIAKTIRWPMLLWQGKAPMTGIEVQGDVPVKCFTGTESYKVI